MHHQDQDSLPGQFHWSWLRVLLCVYFFGVAGIVCTGFVPLPEEPPRVEFEGLAVALASCVIGFFFLISTYRFFILGVLAFLPMTAWYFTGQIKDLEMLLEDTSLERVTLYTLPLVFLVMITPRIWRLFNRPARSYQPKNIRDGRNGIPF